MLGVDLELAGETGVFEASLHQTHFPNSNFTLLDVGSNPGSSRTENGDDTPEL
jgi:hypothetical protein